MNNKYTLSISLRVALATNSTIIHAAYSPDLELRGLINKHGLTGDPSMGRTMPSINSPKAQLGMRLFFNKALGRNKDAACVSCHHPLLGGGDALALSIGVVIY